jgi:adenylate kinase
MATYIVLMGVQGAGKGTQAAILSEKLGLPHITTGGLFRAMKTLDTPLARQIQEIMAQGKLISDDITLEVVRERLSRPDVANGAIFDGFPRTLPQAEGFDLLLKELNGRITVVPVLELPRSVAVGRIAGRWECTKDPTHVYNVVTNPPKTAGICDIDGAALKQRADDTVDAANIRIDTYERETKPLLDFYAPRGLVRHIDAQQPIEKVTEDLLKVVEVSAQK